VSIGVHPNLCDQKCPVTLGVRLAHSRVVRSGGNPGAICWILSHYRVTKVTRGHLAPSVGGDAPKPPVDE
jgi:hypothetical protein